MSLLKLSDLSMWGVRCQVIGLFLKINLIHSEGSWVWQFTHRFYENTRYGL
jgi:hypothetical protein